MKKSMSRVEHIGDATLYLGDCREILPTLGKFDAVVTDNLDAIVFNQIHEKPAKRQCHPPSRSDENLGATQTGNPLLPVPHQSPQTSVVKLSQSWAILTDPPYGIGASVYSRGGTQYGTQKVGCKVYEIKDWDKAPPQEIIDLIRTLDVPTIIFGGNYFELPPSKCWLVWDKQNGDESGYADCELAWTNLDKAVRRIYWRWAGMLQKNMGGKKEERFHPTQKPVGVMEWAINHFPDGIDTILDPFMGSGTTGVACAKLGRKFTGIEIEPSYFDIACKRIEKAYAQPDLFIEPPKKAIQEVML
jgi:hypothetical protein